MSDSSNTGYTYWQAWALVACSMFVGLLLGALVGFGRGQAQGFSLGIEAQRCGALGGFVDSKDFKCYRAKVKPEYEIVDVSGSAK